MDRSNLVKRQRKCSWRAMQRHFIRTRIYSCGVSARSHRVRGTLGTKIWLGRFGSLFDLGNKYALLYLIPTPSHTFYVLIESLCTNERVFPPEARIVYFTCANTRPVLLPAHEYEKYIFLLSVTEHTNISCINRYLSLSCCIYSSKECLHLV